MQIFKPVLIACAAAIIVPLSGHADTEAQIKAREALRDKMKELETQPAEVSQPATPEAVKPQPKQKPAAAPKPTPTPAAKSKPAPVKEAPATVAAQPAETITRASTQVPAGNPAPAALQNTWNSEPLFGGRKKAVANVTPPKPKPVAAATTPAPKPVMASASV